MMFLGCVLCIVFLPCFTSLHFPNRAIRYSTFRSSSNEAVVHESLEQTIDRLRRDRDQKRNALLTLESVLEKAERELNNEYVVRNNSAQSIISNYYDYGFISKSSGPRVSTLSDDGDAVPAGAIYFAIQNFKLELSNLISSFNRTSDAESVDPVKRKLSLLKLSNDAIWARERSVH